MAQKILDNDLKEIDELEIREKAENAYLEILETQPIRKMLYSYIVKKTRYFVRNRENLRHGRISRHKL